MSRDPPYIEARVRPDGGIGGMSYKERAESCPLRIATDRNAREIEKLKEDYREIKSAHHELQEKLLAAVGGFTRELEKLRLEVTPFIHTAMTARTWTDRVLWALVSAALTTAVVFVGGKL
jgi:adenylosuccinate lyase